MVRGKTKKKLFQFMDLVTNKPLFPEVIQKFLKCIYLLYFNESNLRNICLLVFFSFSMELGCVIGGGGGRGEVISFLVL